MAKRKKLCITAATAIRLQFPPEMGRTNNELLPPQSTSAGSRWMQRFQLIIQSATTEASRSTHTSQFNLTRD